MADIATALAELRRVLRTGGRALVLDTDRDSLVWHAADRELHERVVAAWDEHLVHPRLPRTLGGLLRRAGFAITEQRVFPLFNAADAAAWQAGLRACADESDYLSSLNRYVFLCRRT